MIGVLFVDDEPNVLEGLRRLLHAMRKKWDMRFAASGAAALATLAENPAEIVVSDMRMPEMNGARLFSEIENRYPRTARILLTGQSDYEATLRLVGPSQVFLSKPCDGKQLTRAVSQAVGLRNYLMRPELHKVAQGLNWDRQLLPTYFRIRDELLQEKPSSRTIAALIAGNRELERAFLHLADIVYLHGRRVVHPYQAILYLKPDVFRPTIVAATILSLINGCEESQLLLDRLTTEATMVADICMRIGKIHNLGAEICSQAFLAGLLHNTGAAILACNALPSVSDFMRERFSMPPEARARAERQICGVSFAEVGGYLLAEWGLPDALVEAVTYQQQPKLCADPHSPVLSILHVAMWLAGWLAMENGVEEFREDADGAIKLDRAFLQQQNFRLQPNVYRDVLRAMTEK
jgi:DNA-binding NarL/FixJ family response regulator